MLRCLSFVIDVRYALSGVFLCFAALANAQEAQPTESAAAAAVVRPWIDDQAPGWRSLVEDDFTKVNSAEDTWSWVDGVLHCTGQPLSVMRTKEPMKNFELIVEWMHEKPAGN
ncbi:MAG: hypothetical protein ACF788_03105, partial [Novipirellula sp. JB048]